tara:strand:- start:3355 stop:3978 length:624 start_codon:yes stop_codon:yes gene_type:complete
MPLFLVIDFETTGVGKDAGKGYKPYSNSRMPLPRADYPVQLAAELLDASCNVVQSKQMLIRGCERLDPWVLENCSHLSVKDCDRDGVTFEDAVKTLADMVGDNKCTMVAHNIQYDWKDVMLRTARELNLENTSNFRKLASLPQYCTCVNEVTKRERSAYYFSKVGKWIGPKLSNLAKKYGVEYDENAAHDAAYDVRVTSQCLAHLKK